jgi:short-subunit dehydrogenase
MFEGVVDLDVGLCVSNAGGDTTGAHFVDGPLDVYLALINRNCRTLMEALHRFGGRMKQRGRGGLLVMSSVGALWGSPRTALYSATKAFDLTLAEGIWVELKPLGVDVLGVAAPGMDTPTFRGVMARKNITELMPGIYAADDVVRTALARLPGGHIHIFMAGQDGASPEEIVASRRARVEAAVPMMDFMFGTI